MFVMNGVTMNEVLANRPTKVVDLLVKISTIDANCLTEIAAAVVIAVIYWIVAITNQTLISIHVATDINAHAIKYRANNVKRYSLKQLG
jgi:hypothetical protein